MKINQIIVNESMGGTTAGGVATVAKPLGEVQKRVPVQKTTKKKGPYANSLNEGRMKDLDYDLKTMKPAEFQKKYGKKREEMLASFKQQPQQKSQQVPVSEENLKEEDKIIAPGKGHRLKPGLLNKPEVSINPTDSVKIDVPLLIRLLEFAREDASSDLDLHDLAEKLVDRARRGKTLTMKDYEFVVDECGMGGGVVASGMPGESKELDEKAVSKAQQRFMGMAHAIQKGKKIPGASKELKDVAKGMSKKAAHDYAATKHKGLPEKVKKKD